MLSGDIQARMGADGEATSAPSTFAEALNRDHRLLTEGKFAEIEAMWDGFIAAHPKDPRAYSERAGARWHQAKGQAGLADMRKACELGQVESCVDAQRMAERLGVP